MENLSSDGRRGGVQHVLDCASLILKRMKMGSLGMLSLRFLKKVEEGCSPPKMEIHIKKS